MMITVKTGLHLPMAPMHGLLLLLLTAPGWSQGRAGKSLGGFSHVSEPGVKGIGAWPHDVCHNAHPKLLIYKV